MKFVLAAVAVLALASAEVFFQETFNAGWENRWVVSKNKGAEAGAFALSAGKYFNDAEEDKGLHSILFSSLFHN
jgi:calreticulin